MKIAVIGTGYVGLVTGTCFAETGNQVLCVDIDEEKVKTMQSGIVPIYEPGLDVLFHRNIKADRLQFTTKLADAIAQAELIFLALPTPAEEDGSADLSYVLKVAEQLGELIKDYKVIVTKSTVPVGTAEQVAERIAKKVATATPRTDIEFDVVSNPEFLREGIAVEDFMKPDRIVIGTDSQKARKIMERLYAPFVRQGNPIIFMDTRSAEITKYAANSYLAMRISFMNEIANLCELLGADVDMVRKGIGSDTRIGRRFLFPGVGYGGSCFPKDVQALAKIAQENDYDFNILNAVMEVNNRQKTIIIPRIKAFFDNELKDKKIAIWGLAFKPNTDDIREAPSLYIIKELLGLGAKITAFDPEAMDNIKAVFNDKIEYASKMYEPLKDADALVIITEWSVFRTPDFEKMGKLLKNKVIFDGRNLYDLKQMQELGFYYNSIGRGIQNSEFRM